MSIAVPLDELAERLSEFPWGYLVTVRDDGRAQSLAVPTQYVDGLLMATVGKGTAANAISRPRITMLFPGTTGEHFSLIVDGDAEVDEDCVTVTPTWAVLHRPALDSTHTFDPPQRTTEASAGRTLGIAVDRLLLPSGLANAHDVLGSPSAVPGEPGVYAWYFDAVPPGVPTDGCRRFDDSVLLYVGISPKKPSSGGQRSKQNLRRRLVNHYSGNASGSTLRLTLGCLLEEELGISLQLDRDSLTFGAGEIALSSWMAQHARVVWVTDPAPWVIEDFLIDRESLPLNLQGNTQHPFRATLSAARTAARARARDSYAPS